MFQWLYTVIQCKTSLFGKPTYDFKLTNHLISLSGSLNGFDFCKVECLSFLTHYQPSLYDLQIKSYPHLKFKITTVSQLPSDLSFMKCVIILTEISKVVEISDIIKIIFQCKMIIGEHFYIFDNPQYAQYPYNLTSHMYCAKWCILSKKSIFSKFIEISISEEISDHPKNILIGWNMIKRTFLFFTV